MPFSGLMQIIGNLAGLGLGIFFKPVICHCSDMTARHFSRSVRAGPFCEPSVTTRLYNAIPTRGWHLLVDVSPDAGLTGHRHMSLTKQLSDFLGRESNPRSSDHWSDALTIWPSKLPSGTGYILSSFDWRITIVLARTDSSLIVSTHKWQHR